MKIKENLLKYKKIIIIAVIVTYFLIAGKDFNKENIIALLALVNSEQITHTTDHVSDMVDHSIKQQNEFIDNVVDDTKDIMSLIQTEPAVTDQAENINELVEAMPP